MPENRVENPWLKSVLCNLKKIQKHKKELKTIFKEEKIKPHHPLERLRSHCIGVRRCVDVIHTLKNLKFKSWNENG